MNSMKLKLRLLLLLTLLLADGVNLSGNQRGRCRPAPERIPYPGASHIIRTESTTKSLSGVVKPPGGNGLAGALVELVDMDWKNPTDSAFTDSEGRFALADLPDGQYYVKVSKTDFVTLLIRVRLKRKARCRLELIIPVID